MVDNVNKNTISEIHARKNLNALNKIKKTEIKNKCLISGQKELLNLFNNLFDAISSENKNNNNNTNANANNNNNTNTTNNNESVSEIVSVSESVSESESVSVSESENESESVSVSKSVSESESESEEERENKDENEDDGNEDDENKEDENEDKNKDENEEDKNENKNEEYYIIKQINDYFKTIDESISFEEQINLLKKIKFLYEYWDMRYYDDDKELNLKIFILRSAYISNDIDEKLFEEIIGCTFLTLVKN